MPSWQVLALILVGWTALMAGWCLVAVPWLSTGPGGNPSTGLVWLVLRLYAHLVHRVTFEGRENVPEGNCPGPLVVISNHTGPIDPVVIQAACRFEIRWMMASDMMVPQLDLLWRFLQLIPVARNGRDSGPARQAIRHVKRGGVVGIFPEGAIPRPRGELRPFHLGAGLVIARTRAPVLLVLVTGTPDARDMFGALSTPSRAHVRFFELMDFSDVRDPAAITEKLRRRLAEVTGRPYNEEPLPGSAPSPDPFAV
jgi:1-acyl-sn-glycerol-3-phosphate acyltransferase